MFFVNIRPALRAAVAVLLVLFTGACSGGGSRLHSRPDDGIARRVLQQDGKGAVREIADSHHRKYLPGDMIRYAGSGVNYCADARYDISGWFKVEISDEGRRNPILNMNVLTLTESFSYSIKRSDQTGGQKEFTANNTQRRYFVQDENGTIQYCGDELAGPDSSGRDVLWFGGPFVQVESPYFVNEHRRTSYARYVERSGGVEFLDTAGSIVDVEAKEGVRTELGTFEAYRMLFRNPDGKPLRYHWTYPPIGAVKFMFFPKEEGCEGQLEMVMTETNIPY